jgi:hypothetical protein
LPRAVRARSWRAAREPAIATSAQPPAAPPRLVVLPGLDGSARLAAPFLERAGARAAAIAFPPDRPLGYAELRERVRGLLLQARADAAWGHVEAFLARLA